MEYNHGFHLIECKTAKELWERVSPFNPLEPLPNNFIYRGQADSDWKLQPAIFRKKGFPTKIFGRDDLFCEEQIFSEIRILEQFAQYCDRLGLKIPNDSIEFREIHLNSQTCDLYYKDSSKWPKEELIEVMALAQHHGLPTRLLDWSYRATSAIYFAVSGALSQSSSEFDSGKIAVWVLNLERRALYKNLRIVRAPGATSPNLAAQDGLFTLINQTGVRGELFRERSMEDEMNSLRNPPLWKLTLPKSESIELMRICGMHGVSAVSLFPSYEGAARSVADSINVWEKGARDFELKSKTNTPP